MNNELLLLVSQHTDMLIEQTKTNPQETVETKMNKRMDTFSIFSPLNLVEAGKWLLGVTSFDATNSVFNITNENKNFSISTPSYWTPEVGEELIRKLNILLELRSENDIELHEKKVDKKVPE